MCIVVFNFLFTKQNLISLLQAAIRTSYGRRPPTSSKPTTGLMGGRTGTAVVSSLGRPTTGLADGPARPMTGIRGAGYPGTAAGRSSTSGGLFDPLNQAARTAANSSAGLEKKTEETPEEKIKSLERKVTELIEESCIAAARRENKVALDRAKEASAKASYNPCPGIFCVSFFFITTH